MEKVYVITISELYRNRIEKSYHTFYDEKKFIYFQDLYKRTRPDAEIIASTYYIISEHVIQELKK